MSAPAYIVKRVGDQYIPVLKSSNRPVSTAVLVAGGLLTGYLGVRRRGVSGLVATGVGSYLIARGVLGYDPAPILLNWVCPSCGSSSSEVGPTYQNDQNNPSQQKPSDAVDEAAMESFPASDPPAHSASADLTT